MRYLVQHLVDAGADRHPDRIALTCPASGAMTYARLVELSNGLSLALRRAGVTRQSRVVVCLKRSAAYIVAMLGALKADAVFVPLAEKTPATRIGKVLRDCEPKALICDARTVENGTAASGDLHTPLNILTLELDGSPRGLGPDVCASWRSPPAYRNIDLDLAEIIYTSGSTGDPQGVMIAHGNILDYVSWAVSYFDIRPDDRVLSTAPFHFDMSTFDVFATLAAGARLCIAAEGELLFPAALAARMENERVTLWKGVASLLGLMARAGIPHSSAASLTRVIFSGERLPTKYLRDWMAACPRARFFNAYGPTEATGISAVHEVLRRPEKDDEDVPIGRPCANAEVLILDENGAALPAGAAGEICIRGTCLSPGYWNNPQRTAEKFVLAPSPRCHGDRLYRTGDIGFVDANGDLRFVGRLDDQVKFMGHRIELGEITRAILSLDYVLDAAVLLVARPSISTDLIAAFVEFSKGATEGRLVSDLRDLLPAYMIPRLVVPVQSLPRTDRGKVDFAHLRLLAAERDIPWQSDGPDHSS